MEIRVEKLSLAFYDFLLEQETVWAGLNARGIHARLALCIAVFVEAGFSRELLIERAYEQRFSSLSSLKTFMRRQQEMPVQIALGRQKKGPLRNLSLPEIPSMLRHLLSLCQADPIVEKIRMQESRDPTVLNLEVCFESGTFPISSLRHLPELLTGDSRSKILQKTLTLIQPERIQAVLDPVPQQIFEVPSPEKKDMFKNLLPSPDTFLVQPPESSPAPLMPQPEQAPSPRRLRRPCTPESLTETYLEKWGDTRVPIDKR